MTSIADGVQRLDCLGMLCPLPIIKTGRAIRVVDVGTILEVVADDPGVETDLVDWCDANRQELVSMKTAHGVWTTRILRKH
jgi:tRNA 2-thiouridine synthesizing protein A